MRKKREYSLKTEKLLQRIDKVALRQEFVFDKDEISKLIIKVYKLFKLPLPEIVWCKDITDERFLGAAGAAWAAWATGATWAARATRAAWATGATWAARATRATRAARAARAARATRAARAAGAAGAARAAGAAGAAGATGIDYDFDYLVYEHEYLQDHRGNKNDRLALKAYTLFLELKEAGLGYFAEQDGKLYCCPNPIIRLNKKLQYHSNTRSAIEWKDGLKMYYYNGVSVNEKIILYPETLTKKDWMNEENAEVRRVIQEVMGERFVKEIGAKEIHKGKLAKLYEIKLKNDPEKVARYVKVKDTFTPRYYYLRVPPTINNADEGVAWTFGIELGDYKLNQES